MTPCARGCCWTPYGCAQARNCACHWDQRAPSRNSPNVHADPTANQAIGNVMKEMRGK
jgi:hypothetical protein